MPSAGRLRKPRTSVWADTPVRCKYCDTAVVPADMYKSVTQIWVRACKPCWSASVWAYSVSGRTSNPFVRDMRRNMPRVCKQTNMDRELLKEVRSSVRQFRDAELVEVERKVRAAFSVDGELRSAARGAAVHAAPVNKRNPLMYVFVDFDGMLLPARCAQPAPFGLQPTNVMVMTTREARAWISCVVHGRERDAETLAFVREAWERV